MRSRASLPLMELLVMILVFALAAALCLQILVRTQEISLETARRDEAVAIAQNGAELLKAGVRPQQIEKDLSCNGFDVKIRQLQSRIPGLAQAEVSVLYEQQPLFAIHVGWQEVGA